ncbi:unnamed protein product [Brassica oleracea]
MTDCLVCNRYSSSDFRIQLYIYQNYLLNRASWSGGKGTSAEVPAITTSSPGHSGFNIPSVGALDPLRG